MEEKLKFSKEQIVQFKKELYEELEILNGTDMMPNYPDEGWGDLLLRTTPKDYAELLTM